MELASIGVIAALASLAGTAHRRFVDRLVCADAVKAGAFFNRFFPRCNVVAYFYPGCAGGCSSFWVSPACAVALLPYAVNYLPSTVIWLDVHQPVFVPPAVSVPVPAKTITSSAITIAGLSRRLWRQRDHRRAGPGGDLSIFGFSAVPVTRR